MRISLVDKSHAVLCPPMRCTSLFFNLKNYGIAAIRLLHPKTPCSEPAALNHASNRSKPIIQCRSASHNGASASGKGNEDGNRRPWLIVGLGNPGAQYEDTRHNVGFKVVDMIAGDNGISMTRLERRAALGKGTVEGTKVLLAKPMTFMNNSGESVADLANFYKVPLSRVVLVYDDLDTDVGVVRLKMKGGHGGHNGMRSIMARLKGSEDSPRVKIGIGRPAGRKTVVEHVLQPFSKAEAQEIEFAVREAADVLRSILVLGLEKALSGCRL